MIKMWAIIACAAVIEAMVIVQSAAAESSIEGVWRLTNVSMSGPNGLKSDDGDAQPNLWIFTKKHFSVMGVTSDKPRPVQPLDKATNAQKVAAWSDFMAYAGTYEVNGTTLTSHHIVAKNPEEPGASGTFDIKIEGNTLILISKGIPNPITYKFVRLE